MVDVLLVNVTEPLVLWLEVVVEDVILVVNVITDFITIHYMWMTCYYV